MKCSHPEIRKILTDCGRLPSIEIAEFFSGSSQRDVASMLGKMRRAKVKLVYIHSWTRGEPGTRDNPRPVYALGNRSDAKPPRKQTSAEVTAAYRARARRCHAPSSIFDLARFL